MTHIRRALPDDVDAMFDIWKRAVHATHSFVSREDLKAFEPLVREYVRNPHSEFWLLAADDESALGFLGMKANEMEALFLDPEHHGQGGGRALVEHAQRDYAELTVSVNEQNQAACRFYRACGFELVSRSEVDTSGRPYPLLHMRWCRAQD